MKTTYTIFKKLENLNDDSLRMEEVAGGFLTESSACNWILIHAKKGVTYYIIPTIEA